MEKGTTDDLKTPQPVPYFKKGFKVHQGVMFWKSSEIEEVPKFKVRDDDVWVCSFPRSGTTLIQEITYLVMTLDFEKANTVQLDDRFPTTDVNAPEFPYYRGLGYANRLSTYTPRMLKSHFPYFLLPDDLTKRTKGKDKRGTIKKIADFLGRVLTEEMIDKIMEHTTLDHMKENNAVNYSYAEKLFSTDKSEGEFINTGSLDAWKHIVPEDLQKRIDKYIHQELGHTDLKFE